MTFEFYPRLGKNRGDTPDLQKCIESVVQQLKDLPTEDESPGMLLGKIQSGKTRGFVGIIALGFDQGFDLAVVLTKGTKTLSAQTVARLNSDFAEFLAEDSFTVLDVMQLPGRLTGSELRRKIILVAKKEARNLEKVKDFFDDYPQLAGKNVLLIDDEADLASIRFTTNRQGDLEQGSLSEKIDDIRDRTNSISFLQVTATPFSLYLQPEQYEAGAPGNDYVFKPKRPAFTQLLPIHGGYVGGDDYFGDFDDDDPRSYLFAPVPLNELDVLRQQDRRRVKPDNILENQNISGLRRSIITFVAAVCLRRWQQEQAGEKPRKYAMVIHVDTKKSAHAWQDLIMDWLFERISKRASSHPEEIFPVYEEAYEDVSKSAELAGLPVPPARELFQNFLDAFVDDDVVRERVNSDNDVLALLDSNAELKLRTPFNIFIGGNILDRGITIPNLISFYYGRNPRTMQADTVLQHSRMYGNRDRHDLAVTRFYTSQGVYDRLYDINQFENALREAFETGAHDQGVVFLQSDAAGRIRPCAPNKILLSDVVSVRPNGMLIPTSFTTKSRRVLERCDAELRTLLPSDAIDAEDFFDIDLDQLSRIIDCISKTFTFDSKPFEWDALTSLARYYNDRGNLGGKLKAWAETGRNLTREGSGDKSGRSIVGTKLRSKVEDSYPDMPKLILLQQQGRIDQGWSGFPFWWPVLAAPSNTEPCVFAAKIQD